MHVTVDLNHCQGHGLCHMSAPEVFDLATDDGHSIVRVDPVPEELRDGAVLGADSCPELAISIQLD